MFFLTNMAYSSLPVFLPRILTHMNHSALSAQALSAPPYLCAFLAVLFTAHTSDRLRQRARPVVFHALASSAGYAVLALARPLGLPPPVRYLAVFPAAAGFFSVATLLVAWSINNQHGRTRQGGGFVLMQMVGQCGPLLGTRLYPEGQAPYYARGMAACAGAMFLVAGLALLLRRHLSRKNASFDRAERRDPPRGTHPMADHDAATPAGEEEQQGLVDGSMSSSSYGRRRKTRARQSFRYML
ncbi:hypothetical protein E4U41_006004 [Claviceps citrina]|nr:hypothetical protein E4U41_006004 [Claviceps citrina]